MTSTVGIIEVCPTTDELSVEDPTECTVSGCRKVLKSSACLQMHVRRRHEGKSLSVNNEEKRVYYCPVENCDRHKGKNSPFPRLGQLKQHFQSVHSEKKFHCQKCNKFFGLRDVCRRHEAECGQLFRCTTCEEVFRSRNALYQHAKRKNHDIPQGSKFKSIHEMEIPLPINPAAVTTSIEPLHRKHISDASVQTKGALSFVFTDTPLSTSSGCQTLDGMFDLGIHSNNISNVLLSFNPLTPNTSCSTAEAASQSCQTQTLDSSEFGTQTSYPSDDLLATDFGVTTLENFGTQTVEDYGYLDLGTLLPPGCLSFGTQTSLENMGDCLEFGVQTLMQTETKDQESQTSCST